MRRIATIALLLWPAWARAQGQPTPRVEQAEDNESPPRGARPADSPPRVRAAQPIPYEVAPQMSPRGFAVEGARPIDGRDPVEDLLVRSSKGVTLGTMIDELVDELAHQLAKEDPRSFSPLAIRLVRLSPNLRPSLSHSIEAKVTARLGKLPNLAQVVCIECRSVRSRVENGDWVVTLGVTSQADLRRIGADIGAKAFMEIDLTFNQAPAELSMATRIYRASDGHILWTQAIKGDETTAAIMRTGKVPPSREEQLAELKRKMEMRPYFGYFLFLGGGYIQSSGPKSGFWGANIGVRLFERFGHERRHQFGIQGEGFLNWTPDHTLFAGIISGGYFYSLMNTNLNRPDLRIGAMAGGFIAGNEGNSGILQLLVEYVLQFRLAASLSVLYMIPAKYMGEDLGGFGFMARVAFNW